MSLLNKKSLLDLVPGNTPQTSNAQTGELNPPPRTEMVGHMGRMNVPPFDNGPEPQIPGKRDTLHEKSLGSADVFSRMDVYMSKINPDSKYGAGQAGGPGWPAVNPSGFDLNGNTPTNYMDNLPK